VFGKKTWNLQTFGSKGEDVLNVLRHNLPREYKTAAKGFEKMVFDVHKPWLENVIHMRDRINHYLEEGISPGAFSIFRQDDKIRVPMVTEQQSVVEVMDIVWVNFLNFVEDFIAMTLAFKTKDDFCFFGDKRIPQDSPQPRWAVVLKTQRDQVVKNPGWEEFQ
jgi:hypothetical protein